jgi:TolA-binding protein
LETTHTRTSPLPVHDAFGSAPGKLGFLDRLQTNRGLAIRLAVAVAVLVIVVGATWAIFSARSNAADVALAQAMEVNETPIAVPGQPTGDAKTFNTVEERARAANPKFAEVAGKYGMTAAGRNALFLQGVTAMQMGQNSTAETLLKKSADSWNRDIADMSEMTLAGLYHATGRQSEAVAAYNRVIAKPSTVVPVGLAQLQLAAMYEADGKSGEAKKIYAQIKDKDPKSAAADLAQQKLGISASR